MGTENRKEPKVVRWSRTRCGGELCSDALLHTLLSSSPALRLTLTPTQSHTCLSSHSFRTAGRLCSELPARLLPASDPPRHQAGCVVCFCVPSHHSFPFPLPPAPSSPHHFPSPNPTPFSQPLFVSIRPCYHKTDCKPHPSPSLPPFLPPGNVLLDAHLNAKLADVGIATVVSKEDVQAAAMGAAAAVGGAGAAGSGGGAAGGGSPSLQHAQHHGHPSQGGGRHHSPGESLLFPLLPCPHVLSSRALGGLAHA